MKKLLIIVIILVLVFTACGGNKKESNGVSAANNGDGASAAINSSNNTGNGKAAAFFNMFSSGTYHMKAKIVGGGMETTMETFMKGDLMANTVEMGGETTRMILRDNKMYMINDTAKTIMTLPSMANMSEETVKTDGMNLTGSGTAQFNGKNLPYEEYSDGEGNKAQYFMDGNNLAGIRNVTGEGNIDVIILALDQNVPGNAFEIPSGYQEMGLF